MAPAPTPPESVVQPSATYQLADLLLREAGHESLETFVRSRRAAKVAWRKVTRELWFITAHRVDLSHETLREWFPEGAPSKWPTQPNDTGPMERTG